MAAILIHSVKNGFVLYYFACKIYKHTHTHSDRTQRRCRGIKHGLTVATYFSPTINLQLYSLYICKLVYLKYAPTTKNIKRWKKKCNRYKNRYTYYIQKCCLWLSLPPPLQSFIRHSFNLSLLWWWWSWRTTFFASIKCSLCVSVSFCLSFISSALVHKCYKSKCVWTAISLLLCFFSLFSTLGVFFLQILIFVALFFSLSLSFSLSFLLNFASAAKKRIQTTLKLKVLRKSVKLKFFGDIYRARSEREKSEIN